MFFYFLWDIFSQSVLFFYMSPFFSWVVVNISGVWAYFSPVLMPVVLFFVYFYKPLFICFSLIFYLASRRPLFKLFSWVLVFCSGGLLISGYPCLKVLLVFLFFWMMLPSSPLSFSFLWWSYYSPLLGLYLGVDRSRPVTGLIAPYIFFGLLFLLFEGFIPYGYPVFLSARNLFIFSTSMWLIAFLYAIRTEGWGHFIKGPSPFCYFIAPLEFIGEFVKPVSLGVRLYANIMFGHYLLEGVFYVSSYLGPFGCILATPFVLFELCVFVIQAYIFTYLVLIYFGEK